MMVVMGHGLCVSFCVCGESMKIKVGPKQVHCTLEHKGHLPVSDTSLGVTDGRQMD